MKRPVGVLLLLASAAAVQYRWQAAVSLPGPAVQTIPAVSRLVCALRCEALPSEQCSGFVYEAGDGTCRLFSGDCRGPAANSSQLTEEHYLGRSTCPGTPSDRCGCPSGFRRCAGRCLARLDPRTNYTEAESRCAELGAHLAIPRSEAENQCAITLADGSSVWLGMTDVVTEGQFVGADGCGVVSSDDPAWALNQLNNLVDEDFGWLNVDLVKNYHGWHDAPAFWQENALCQLPLCYQLSCP